MAERQYNISNFDLVIIAKLKRDNLYDLNDKSLQPYVMRLPDFIFFITKTRKCPIYIENFGVVRATGLEPGIDLTLEPRENASANSATPPRVYFNKF